MKWTWLDEIVHSIIALMVIVPTVVVLVGRAFNPSVYVPPELITASAVVLSVYGFSAIKANTTPTTPTPPAPTNINTTQGDT